MTQEQHSVLAGMFVAAALSALAFVGTYVLADAGLNAVVLPVDTALGFIALPLAISIGFIARKRFFDESIIEGAAYDQPKSSIAIDKAILENTVEQTLLAALAYVALGTVSGHAAEVLMPMLVIFFLVGRALFARGYVHGASARALGFGLTFYPSLFALMLFSILAALQVVT